MDPAAEPPLPDCVPWKCVFIGPDGRRRTQHRWSRPTASAVEIADEVMAVFAAKVFEGCRGDRRRIGELLAGCVVQVTRPEHDGWPAQYGESHGVTWLRDARERVEPDRGEQAA